jgi:hypothetical protein
MSSVGAHHSATPFYDDTKTVEIEGVVSKWSFVNPHPFLYVDVADAQGGSQEWIIEFAGPVRLKKIGWSAETFKPGERITAIGHPPKVEGAYGMFSPRIIREDGTVLQQAGEEGGAGGAPLNLR